MGIEGSYLNVHGAGVELFFPEWQGVSAPSFLMIVPNPLKALPPACRPAPALPRLRTPLAGAIHLPMSTSTACRPSPPFAFLSKRPASDLRSPSRPPSRASSSLLGVASFVCSRPVGIYSLLMVEEVTYSDSSVVGPCMGDRSDGCVWRWAGCASIQRCFPPFPCSCRPPPLRLPFYLGYQGFRCLFFFSSKFLFIYLSAH